MQLSLKVSAGVKEQFTAVAAAHGLAFGELLERALEAFVREQEGRARAGAVVRPLAGEPAPPRPHARSAGRWARAVNSGCPPQFASLRRLGFSFCGSG